MTCFLGGRDALNTMASLELHERCKKFQNKRILSKKMRIFCVKDDFLTYEVAFVGVFPVKYVSVVYQNVRRGELSLMV